ncbi:DUF3566 domain-containing protein [Rhodococcus chondri]|uniref:DUF3566 domain-containing protein n=1 Tax=Rhodococcus chondri TaxID=3065941 RepID=A0ABU7JNZ0_9NOCA|nr:DUF3566 domain-containing protein [Rhodococcus sp. CC-R104]MEE2031757.1 DUF3566 domain-containing protein [Rhodococcus sp. CC-R104]
MSTPQGPSGAEQRPPARTPEIRNGQEVSSAPPGPVSSPESTPKDSAPRGSTPKDQAPSPASKTPAPADKPPVAKPAAEAPGLGGNKTVESPTSKPPQAGGKAAPAAGAANREGDATGAGQRPAQAARPAGPKPPWQRGQQQGAQGPAQGSHQNAPPQNKPQTNVPGVGLGKSSGGQPAGAPQRERSGSPQSAAGPSGATQQKAPNSSGAAPSTRPVITGTAAPSATGGAQSADRNAAKAKAAVIDGPTRHIERKDLAKDLPDLSSVKHPTAQPAPEAPHAAPVAVPAAVGAGDPLRATVQVRRIDPWSMLKISSVISISLFFVWMIAVGLLYGVLAGMGVWERLNSAFTDIVSDAGSDGLVTAGQVFGYATVIGLANTVLLTALATIGAFIYNLCTDLVGGVQVTLADPD